MKVEVTGPSGSPKLTSYTVNDLLVEKGLAQLYGIALAGCHTEAAAKEVRGIYSTIQYIFYQQDL